MTTLDFLTDTISHMEKQCRRARHTPETWAAVMDALAILDDAHADVEADSIGTDEQPAPAQWIAYLGVTEDQKRRRQGQPTPCPAPSLAGDGRAPTPQEDTNR